MLWASMMSPSSPRMRSMVAIASSTLPSLDSEPARLIRLNSSILSLGSASGRSGSTVTREGLPR